MERYDISELFSAESHYRVTQFTFQRWNSEKYSYGNRYACAESVKAVRNIYCIGKTNHDYHCKNVPEYTEIDLETADCIDKEREIERKNSRAASADCVKDKECGRNNKLKNKLLDLGKTCIVFLFDLNKVIGKSHKSKDDGSYKACDARRRDRRSACGVCTARIIFKSEDQIGNENGTHENDTAHGGSSLFGLMPCGAHILNYLLTCFEFTKKRNNERGRNKNAGKSRDKCDNNGNRYRHMNFLSFLRR